MTKQITKEILEFKNLEEYQKLRQNYQNAQKVKFNCYKCQKEVIRNLGRVVRLVVTNSFNFLCKECQRKQTSLEKYGVEEPNNSIQVKQKSLETKRKNGTLNSEKRLEALRKVFKEKSKEIKEKRKQTNLERYGQEKALYTVTCPFCGQEMDNTHLTRHKNCCEKNPKNFIEEKEGIVELNTTTIQKLNNLSKSLRAKKKVKYICNNCKKEIILRNIYAFKSFNTCPACERKQTNLKRYGTETPAENKDIKEKVRKSHLQHTKQEIENINQKRKQTCLKKYGVEVVGQNKEIKEKQIQTLINKTPEEKAEIQEKRSNTMLEKYGVEHALQNKNIQKRARKKYEKTCLERYGILHAPRSTYTFDNTKFDSIPELAFWIYCKDHNLNIIRCPTEFKYIVNNKEYTYIPDFEVDEKIYEIKGNHFLNKDGTWHNPFSKNAKDNEVTEAKHQCALKNNVTILYYEQYKKYLDYIENNYKTLDYLQQFKNS